MVMLVLFRALILITLTNARLGFVCLILIITLMMICLFSMAALMSADAYSRLMVNWISTEDSSMGTRVRNKNINFHTPMMKELSRICWSQGSISA